MHRRNRMKKLRLRLKYRDGESRCIDVDDFDFDYTCLWYSLDGEHHRIEKTHDLAEWSVHLNGEADEQKEIR